MERYFAQGLESSAPTVSEGGEMPTVQNLGQGEKEVWGNGENLTSCVGVNDKQEQEPCRGGGKPLRERRGDSITPLGRSHHGGGEGVVVESHDDFPGVEISIAGGVGEMVCV